MSARPFRRSTPARLALAALACALAAGPAAAQKLYKWTDENGKVHYTDKAPDPGVGGVQLDKQGRPVRKIEPAPTAQQIRDREAEAERKQALAREQEIALRKDRALLSSFTTEAEIDLARARAVATVETQVASSRAYIAQLDKRKKDIDGRKARLAGKPVPPALERESETVDAEIAKNTELIEQRQRELASVTARYDADKVRWRELKAQADANEAALRAAGRPTATTTPTAAVKK